MQNTFAVAKREFASYFNSPIAYLVATVYLILAEVMFFQQVFITAQADVRPFFSLAPLLFFMITPFLTMRLLAEERAQGTLELLLTMPVTDWQVVAGKFLASMGLISVMLLLTLSVPISVAQLGQVDKGAVVAAYLGMLLLCGTYSAIGVMASSFTKNQNIAAMIALFIGFFLFIIGQMIEVMPPSIAPLVAAISLQTRFQNIARGVIDTRDILYYASMIFGCLLIAETTLESRRWR